MIEMALPGVYTKEEKQMLADWNEALAGMGGWVGREIGDGLHYPGVSRVATKEMISFVAYAMDYWNPLWRDENYAKNTRWGGIIAPPFFKSAMIWGAPHPKFASPNPQFYSPPGGGFMKIDYLGTNYQFFKPIRVNDSFRVFVTPYILKDVTNPDGSGPHIYNNICEMKFFNQKDELVGIDYRPMLFTISSEPVNMAGSSLPDYVYTSKELETIDRIADEEEIRGAIPRYWEDINVGDKLKPIVYGPITTYDQVVMMSGTGHAMVPMREFRRKAADKIFLDPVTGVSRVTLEYHLSKMVSGNVLGAPPEMLGHAIVMGRLITNWMGDDGFLKRFEWRRLGLLEIGAAAFGRGKVVKKYKAGGEYLVDLLVWLESIRGHIPCFAFASVSLPSKEDPNWGLIIT
jgi:acyl dehydratase